MADQPVCQECGAAITAASPGALCTRCLLAKLGLGLGKPLSDADAGDSSAPIFPPARIGDYQLLEEIGRGGMGIVYRARQLAAGRTVALKLIAAGDLAAPELIRRFKSEAETAAALEHPGIVPVYEVGEHDGRHYFSMRLIQGESLAGRLAKIRRREAASFAAGEAAGLVEKLARAVHFAHQRGVLHRDVKPGNILLDEKGEPHLTDFGLAKWIQHDTSLTRTHSLLGTPAYMAPEQAKGGLGSLTTAADVYSLGVVLYELLAGTPPFLAENSYELIRKVIEDEPAPLSQHNPAIGLDLGTICLKCLEKDPARRYPTALSLAEDLGRWRNHEPISARSAGWGERLVKWSRRHPVRTALIAVVSLGAVVLSSQQQRHASAMRKERDIAREAQRRAESTVLAQRLIQAGQLLAAGKTADALAEWARVLRAEPSNLVAASRAFSTLSHRSFVLPLAGARDLPLLATTLEFSPDGKSVLVSNREETRMLDAQNFEPIHPRSRLPFNSSRARWSRDGQRVALVHLAEGGAFVRDALELKPLFPPIPLKIWSEPMFSADGKWLAVAGGEGPDIWVQNLGTGQVFPWQGSNEGLERKERRSGAAAFPSSLGLVIPVDGGVRAWPFAPNSSGSRLFPTEGPVNRILVHPAVPAAILELGDGKFAFWDAAGLEPLWPGIKLQRTIDHDFNPSGLLFATAHPERWGQLWDLESGVPLGEPALRHCTAPRVRFAPDGHSLLLFGDPEGIHPCDARNGAMQSFAFRHGAAVTHAEFSPSGQQVITSSDDTRVRFWNPATGDPAPMELPHPAAVRSAQFAAEGSLVVTVDTENTVRLWRAASGALFGQPQRQEHFVHAAVVDPAGDWLACATAAGWSLYALSNHAIAPIQGEPAHKIPSIQFSRDGRSLLTLSVTDAQEDLVRIWTPGASAPRWTLPESKPYVRAALSGDARLVAVAGADAIVRIWSTETSQPLGAPIQHKDQVWVLAFSSDARLLLTASFDRKAQVWDVRTGLPIGEPMLHESGVWQAQFSPDNNRILTSTAEGVARVWDAHSGQPLTEPFPGHPVSVHIIMSPSTSARFSPDGRRIVLPCADQAARLVELPPTDPPPAWLPGFIEAIAGQRWETPGLKVLPWADLYEVRAQLSRQRGTNDLWLAWAQWFFADRLERPLTPYSTQSMGRLADKLAAEGSVRSLVEALQIHPNHPVALEKLARHWSDHGAPAFPGRKRIGEHLRQRAAGSPRSAQPAQPALAN